MKKFQKRLCLLLSLTMILYILMGCGAKLEKRTTEEKKADTNTATEETTTESSNDDIQTTEESVIKEEFEIVSGKHHVEIEVKDYGTISIELDADVAPITTSNFIDLAKNGFYDGLTFHRIMDGFMIQGGDPLGNGTGGSGRNIMGEFSLNGIENTIPHIRGTISMARANDFGSASSQFFIVQSDSTFLDGQYAAFGSVTEGMDIVDQICKDVQVEDNNGTVLPENQPTITSITVID